MIYKKGINKVLEELIADDNTDQDIKIKNIISKLADFYNESGIRHYYSEVSQVVLQYSDNKERNKSSEEIVFFLETMEILIDRIDEYRVHINKYKNGKEIEDKIYKLYDHISLEEKRMSSLIDKNITINKNIESISENIEDISKNIEEFEYEKFPKMREESNKLINKTQREYITILGIFASIVITFMSGMIFSSSVLDNINAISVFRLIFILDLIGLVLFNLVFMFMDFIVKINKIELVKKKWIVNPVFLINTIILLILVADFIAWYFLR